VQVPEDVHTMSDSQKANITVTEIRTKKDWISSLYLELSNYKDGGIGEEDDCDSYTLPTTKRLVKIDTNYNKDEWVIKRLVFRFDDGTHKSLGTTDYGRVESF
jgi:hypothetical protein